MNSAIRSLLTYAFFAIYATQDNSRRTLNGTSLGGAANARLTTAGVPAMGVVMAGPEVALWGIFCKTRRLRNGPEKRRRRGSQADVPRVLAAHGFLAPYHLYRLFHLRSTLQKFTLPGSCPCISVFEVIIPEPTHARAGKLYIKYHSQKPPFVICNSDQDQNQSHWYWIQKTQHSNENNAHIAG